MLPCETSPVKAVIIELQNLVYPFSAGVSLRILNI